MNKKILIASIVASVVLIGVSFTSVVGFNSDKSTSAINSPLFGIRSQRATNRLAKRVVTSDYIGKRKTITISFPTKNSTLLLFQRVIDGISKMNDKIFAKFLDITIS
ncbi:MAG: hypothetical protein JSW06_01180 [Thermoplasmatales archaeon]|nr:MAG: hypothetical protein JSW06_01180 [Thermoplasmatales archaeon]